MFNGITPWIEEIVEPCGFSTSQAGLAGGLMLNVGIAGAVVLPLVSDSLLAAPFGIVRVWFFPLERKAGGFPERSGNEAPHA
jgi:hypothetical protein